MASNATMECSARRRIRLDIVVTAAALLVSIAATQSGGAARDWPRISTESKPWTRWWWHGSAVDRRSLTEELRRLSVAGIGGVEVTPIYGVRGAEARFIQYLSPAWVDMLDHTLREAASLGMGVDMATGTGWPFGGPWVDDEMAARSIARRMWTLQTGERLREPVRSAQAPLLRAISRQIRTIADIAEPVSANSNLQALALEQVKYPRDLPLVALVAYGPRGETIDLTSRVGGDRMLDWTAPSGPWTLYGLFPAWHGKLVERAAPGGEGMVIDHFSRRAIDAYLAPFTRAFENRSIRRYGRSRAPVRKTSRRARSLLLHQQSVR